MEKEEGASPPPSLLLIQKGGGGAGGGSAVPHRPSLRRRSADRPTDRPTGGRRRSDGRTVSRTGGRTDGGLLFPYSFFLFFCVRLLLSFSLTAVASWHGSKAGGGETHTHAFRPFKTEKTLFLRGKSDLTLRRPFPPDKTQFGAYRRSDLIDPKNVLAKKCPLTVSVSTTTAKGRCFTGT